MPEAPPVVGGSGTAAPGQFSGKLGGLGPGGLNPVAPPVPVAAPMPAPVPMPAVAPVPVRAPTRAPVAAAAPTPANPKGMFTQGNALAIPAPISAPISAPVSAAPTQNTGRQEFDEGSYYTPGTYANRFISAKDINYSDPGGVAKFYGMTTGNIFAPGQFLNKFQTEAVKKGITTGGNAKILSNLRSNKNVLGQNPAQATLLRKYLTSGTVPEGLSPDFAISAYDWAIREESRKQQNKPPSLFRRLAGPVASAATNKLLGPIGSKALGASLSASLTRQDPRGTGAPAGAFPAPMAGSAPVAGLAANVNPKGMFMRGNAGAIPAPIPGLNMRNALTG